MTELGDYLDAAIRGTPRRVDWAVHPWAAAQPALHWLGVAPSGGSARVERHLARGEAKLISDHMVRTLLDENLGLVWSSHLLETGLDAIAAAVGGPPEPLLESVWDLLRPMDLDARVYEFCRAFGAALLGRYRAAAGWELLWMLGPPTPSQACFRFWTIGVKPEIWNTRLETETMQILNQYPFRF